VAAAFALGSIGAADADDALNQALTKNDNPFLQMVAAWALAKIHPEDEALVKQAVEKLTQGLASDDSHIRTAAARGLEKLQAPPELVAPTLLAVANDPDPQAAANVIIALASLGEKIVPKASEALQKPDRRELAVKVLTRLGPKASGAVQPLIDVSQQATPEFRTEIQFALAAIGPAAAPATSMLTASLTSPEDSVRESALYALRQIGPGAKDAVPALISVAEGSDQFESLAAAWAVATIAPTDTDAVSKVMPVLTHGLTDNEEQTRMETAMALGDLGPAATPAVELLTRVAHEDSSAAVREAAEESLRQISAAP
jgi:HEAT repeat protein